MCAVIRYHISDRFHFYWSSARTWQKNQKKFFFELLCCIYSIRCLKSAEVHIRVLIFVCLTQNDNMFDLISCFHWYMFVFPSELITAYQISLQKKSFKALFKKSLISYLTTYFFFCYQQMLQITSLINLNTKKSITVASQITNFDHNSSTFCQLITSNLTGQGKKFLTDSYYQFGVIFWKLDIFSVRKYYGL